MNMLDVLIFFGLGIVIGYVYSLWRIRGVIIKLAEQEGFNLEKNNTIQSTVEKRHVHKLEVEQINQVLYLYDRETKDFVCQGSSIEELATLSKTYKNILSATVIHNDRVYLFLNGNSKEFIS